MSGCVAKMRRKTKSFFRSAKTIPQLGRLAPRERAPPRDQVHPRIFDIREVRFGLPAAQRVQAEEKDDTDAAKDEADDLRVRARPAGVRGDVERAPVRVHADGAELHGGADEAEVQSQKITPLLGEPPTVQSGKNVNEAIKEAKSKAHKDDLILICGSVFLVGEVNSA